MASPSETHATPAGVGDDALAALVELRGAGPISAERRRDELARFQELPVRQTLKATRSWKRDLTKIDLSALEPAATGEGDALRIELPAQAASKGVLVAASRATSEGSAVSTAFRDAFERARTSREDKFAALTLAFQNAGAYVFVPANVHLEEPIVLAYAARPEGLFPYTLIELGEGASATIVERIAGEPAAFACGLTQLFLAERAMLRYAAFQELPADATCVLAREARLGPKATLELAISEDGGAWAVERAYVEAAGQGAHAQLTAFFFADGTRHVNVATEIVHAAPDTTSHTLVRSAGIEAGQGRYVGTIRILRDAHGADAALRDDALLLSPKAHVDSVPALEIAANDVKAFHGATVGSISEDELFYAQSRGIPRREAERMIALGFFEPALTRLPAEALREAARASLTARIDRAG